MIDREVAIWCPRGRGPGLFEPAPPLGVDKLPAVLDEFAPGVPLSERDGKLGLKLVVNRLVVADNGVDVLIRPASGVGERMDRGGHPAGYRPVARAPSWVGDQGRWAGHHSDAKDGSGWLTSRYAGAAT